jgi:hypothetical protein
MGTECAAGARTANLVFAVRGRRAAPSLTRRLLALFGLATGCWLLTCLLHAAPATAETSHPVPVPVRVLASHHVGLLGGGATAGARQVGHVEHSTVRTMDVAVHAVHSAGTDAAQATDRLVQGVRRTVTRTAQLVRTTTHRVVAPVAAGVRRTARPASLSAPQLAVRHLPTAAPRSTGRAGQARVGADRAAPIAGTSRALPDANRVAATRSAPMRATRGAGIPPAAPTTPAAPSPGLPAAPASPGRPSTDPFAATLPTAAHPAALVLRTAVQVRQAPLPGSAAHEPTFSPD